MSAPLDGLDRIALSAALGELSADGWLVFDFHGINPVQARIVGVTGMATRRLFVWIPRAGAPVALAHRIELQGLDAFPGERRAYASWRELHAELRALVATRVVAMELSPLDAIPYLDRVPAGVVDLVRSLGGTVVSSGPLVTRFAARWSALELDGHRRAAEVLAAVAGDALRWAGAETARGAEVGECGLQQRVLDALERGGLKTDEPPIVAFQEHAALPHYSPQAGSDRRLESGHVVLLDLWAGPALGTVFADQTWMAFVGSAPDAEVRRVWDTVQAARDAVVDRLREWWRQAPLTTLTGADLDDVARGVVRGAGYGEHFTHRTGHSIDRDLHGSGPHLDNYETSDDRALIAGIGFSVEPGIYLPGRFGMRSEINVFLGESGPEVTPAHPQSELLLV